MLFGLVASGPRFGEWARTLESVSELGAFSSCGKRHVASEARYIWLEYPLARCIAPSKHKSSAGNSVGES